jgi:hypothetical protein
MQGRHGAPNLRRSVPDLDHTRHPTATYWLETNGGIAFEHVGRLDLVVEHYGTQLAVVDAVHAEWDKWSDPPPKAPSQYAPDDIRRDYQRKLLLWQICGRLVATATDVLGEPVELPLTETDNVNRLRDELALMPVAGPLPDPDDPWKDRGECASVRAADLREPPAILITNDGKAARLAFNHGIAARTTAEVLREIVLAGTGSLTCDDAWHLHQQMTHAAKMPKDKLPTGPDFFAT